MLVAPPWLVSLTNAAPALPSVIGEAAGFQDCVAEESGQLVEREPGYSAVHLDAPGAAERYATAAPTVRST